MRQRALLRADQVRFFVPVLLLLSCVRVIQRNDERLAYVSWDVQLLVSGSLVIITKISGRSRGSRGAWMPSARFSLRHDDVFFLFIYMYEQMRQRDRLWHVNDWDSEIISYFGLVSRCVWPLKIPSYLVSIPFSAISVDCICRQSATRSRRETMQMISWLWRIYHSRFEKRIRMATRQRWDRTVPQRFCVCVSAWRLLRRWIIRDSENGMKRLHSDDKRPVP